MRHEYDGNYGSFGELHLNYLRSFLDAFPDPPGDWQECSWGDISPTDERVKAEYISGTIIEGVPDGISDDGIYLVDSIFMPHSTDAKWHRIPSPDVHPDPTESPVIIVHKARVFDFPQGGQAMMWNGDSYENAAYEFFCNDITDWTSARVIADE